MAEPTEIGNVQCVTCLHVRAEHHWEFCNRGHACHLYCEVISCQCREWVEGELLQNASWCEFCEEYYTDWSWHQKMNHRLTP